MVYGRNLLGDYTALPVPRGIQCLLWGPTLYGQSMGSELPVKHPDLFDHFITSWELELLT